MGFLIAQFIVVGMSRALSPAYSTPPHALPSSVVTDATCPSPKFQTVTMGLPLSVVTSRFAPALSVTSLNPATSPFRAIPRVMKWVSSKTSRGYVMPVSSGSSSSSCSGGSSSKVTLRRSYASGTSTLPPPRSASVFICLYAASVSIYFEKPMKTVYVLIPFSYICSVKSFEYPNASPLSAISSPPVNIPSEIMTT